MSETDLPRRLDEYGANVSLRRIALTQYDVEHGGLPSFEADTKTKDPRHRWFVENYGPRCWELDALPPPDLRARVREAIVGLIDVDAWNHCARIEAAERESLRSFQWGRVFSDWSENTEGRADV